MNNIEYNEVSRIAELERKVSKLENQIQELIQLLEKTLPSDK